MLTKVAFALCIVVLVVNFFQPVMTFLPHRGAEWATPWPTQSTYAAVNEAFFSGDDLIRAIAGALVAIMVRDFLNGLGRLIDAFAD